MTPLISRRRQEEVSRVERGERHCKECNVDFDRDFLEAYALSGRDRQTCARCKKPTAAGPVTNWVLKSERVQVEIAVNGETHRVWRHGTLEPNAECLHAVGGHVYCCDGRRVTTRDERDRPSEQSLVREGQLCTTDNELVDLAVALEKLQECKQDQSVPHKVAAPLDGAVTTGTTTGRKWPRLPLKDAPPLSVPEMKAQRQLMDKLGIEFWEGPQMRLYEEWTLHEVRTKRRFPEYYAYLPKEISVPT